MRPTLLIYRLGSLGDTVVALPCFHKIMSCFPDHRRVVLTNFPMSSKAAPIQAILEPGGFIDGAIAYPYGTRSPTRIVSLIRQIRALRVDILVYVGGGRGVRAVCRDLCFFRLAGIRQVIGAPVTPDLDACRWDEAAGEMERECVRLIRCLHELGPIDIDDPAVWDLRLTPAEFRRADEVLGEFATRRFIVANTGGKLAVQDWGDGNWIDLLSGLSRGMQVPLVFIGGTDDRERAARLAANWDHPVLNACGQLSPRETAALLRRATAFIGHDSGPLHLAAANGVACVAMFGSNNPAGKWYPKGPQHRVHRDAVDVRNIRPETVEASVRDIWPAHAQAETA